MICRLASIVATIIVLANAGCGQVRGISGGTAGKIHDGETPFGEIQITIYKVDGPTPIGFAESKSNGSFELVSMGAKGPLQLSPGKYCCTLESAGAALVIPKEYVQPETTPLKIEWPTSSKLLDLEFKPAKPKPKGR